MSPNFFPLGKSVDGVYYEIDTDKSRLDTVFIHDFLASSHWAEGIPRAVIKRAIKHSIAFGLYRDGRQVGFARAVTDHATFAYLADVFVVTAERGRELVPGLSKPSWRIPIWGDYAAGFWEPGMLRRSIAGAALPRRPRHFLFWSETIPTVYRTRVIR